MAMRNILVETAAKGVAIGTKFMKQKAKLAKEIVDWRNEERIRQRCNLWGNIFNYLCTFLCYFLCSDMWPI